ncbi:DUF7660 family protein [Pontimicrobium sp. MEBiC01747]
MTRIEFIEFLEEFKTDFEQNKENWENVSISDFLESMIAYTNDIQGFYDNMKMDINADNPTWENFSLILKGASIYE